MRTYRVVAVLHIQFKLIATHLARAYGVDILHHQVPRTFVLRDRGVIATLQHFQQQGVGCFERLAGIRGELTHLIHLSRVGIFVCYRQHLILVQCRFQRDISQCGIQRIFAIAQQSCRLYFLIVFADLHTCQSLHDATHLLNIAHGWITLCQCLVEGISFVVRCACARRCSPLCILDMRGVILTQVCQCDYVTCLFIVRTLIGHPHLNTVNGHTARYVWQRFHSLLIVIAEVVTEEEVTVLVIVVDRHLKVRRLCATFAAHGLTLRVLL